MIETPQSPSRVGPPLTAGLRNASEVLQLAVRMEEISKDFYEALADGCGEGPVATLSRRLALAEGRHRLVFTGMLDKAFKVGVDVRLTEAQMFQATALARKEFLPDPKAVHRVALDGQLKAAVEMAMQMEKGMIHFYEELRPILGSAQATLDDLVSQEQSHLKALLSLRV